MKKRDLGQFFTKKNIWLSSRVKRFLSSSKCTTVIDPYAGGGDLLKQVRAYKKELKIFGYDIDPSLGWKINDSLKDIPRHKNALVITNPPYYSKVSATTSKKTSVLKYFKNNKYEDLYQIAIEKTLQKYDKAVFIIPETFINKLHQKEHLKFIEVLDTNPFLDTTTPTCVAVFDKSYIKEKKVYYKNKCITTDEIDFFKSFAISSVKHEMVKFNKANPQIGIMGFDSASGKENIKFLTISKFKERYNISKIKNSSRAFYVATLPKKFKITEKIIKAMNEDLEKIREKYFDITFSPFKSFSKLGKKRRRMDFKIARYLILKQFTEAKMLDYKKIYKEALKRNINKIKEEIDTPQMIEKIISWSEKFDKPFDDVRSKIESDEMFSYNFIKDPGRQSIHEKAAFNYIKEMEGVVSAELLPKSGKKAKFINNGKIINKKTNNCKSIDFQITTEKSIIWVTHKYTNESGGMQDNQFKDACLFIEEASKKPSSDKFIAVLDGDYYTDKKMEDIKSRIKQKNILAINIEELKVKILKKEL